MAEEHRFRVDVLQKCRGVSRFQRLGERDLRRPDLLCEFCVRVRGHRLGRQEGENDRV
jgi:hypothetical protein